MDPTFSRVGQARRGRGWVKSKMREEEADMGVPQDLGWTMFLVLAVTAACWLFIVVVASGAARLSHAHDTTAKASVRALPVRHHGGRSAA